MAPAERADVIVDFTDTPAGNYVLRNVGPDEPLGGDDFLAAKATTTGQILQFRVKPGKVDDMTTPPKFLQLPTITPLGDTVVYTRKLALLEKTTVTDEPVEVLLGIVDDNGQRICPKLWEDPVTENPANGTVEIWEFYNGSGDAHPIHVHEVAFEVVERQDIFVDDFDKTQFAPDSVPIPPEPWETGVKDTVIAYPNQVTRIKARFSSSGGQFVWHCHIVEHEDNGMMRPYRVGSMQVGQPQPIV
jgi:FtsP/CotA-like multicopper oxidase with cupredoxin domain